MNTNTIQQRRLQRELEMVANNKITGTTAFPISEDLREWTACIRGPEDTPYSEGNFELGIIFPDSYPFDPPKIIFNTKIFHPNISPDGKICVDILKDKWTPSLSILKVILSILSLLSSPNGNDPLAPEIGKIFMRDRNEFDRLARECTKRFAIPLDKREI